MPPVVEDRYVPPRRPPLPEVWPWLLVLLLLVVGGLLAWYFLSRGNGHHKRRATTAPVVTRVTVPRLIGLQEAAALRKLSSAGLVPRTAFTASSFAPGTVFGQDPTQNTRVAPRSTVTLVVSSGKANVTVPNVVGLKTASATAKVRAAKLNPTTRLIRSGRPAGVVIAQSPVAGKKVGKGETVTLSVSNPGSKVAVPNVVGQPQAGAQAAVRGAGLVPASTRVASTQPKGIVVAQRPAAGTKLAKGSKVRLNVSLGPQTTTTAPPPPPPPAPAARVKVPNVVGLSQTTAQRRLQRVRLKASVTYVASSKPAGQVVSQRPPAGTSVKRGTRVAIRVSNGPSPKPLKTVPDVLGQDEGTATATLQQAGFTVVTIDQPTTDQTQNGIVLDEQPAPGSRIPGGSQVTIYVGVFSG